MKHGEFFNLIKTGALSGAYLMHGEEEYIKDSALTALQQIVFQPELNMQRLDTTEPNALITACETLPFMAPQRLVLCRALPTGEAGQMLKDYLTRLPSTTLLVFFIRGKADGTSALYKLLSKEGRTVDFDMLPPDEAARWLGRQAKLRGVTITPATATRMVSLVGVELSTLGNEFTKAADYAGQGNEITNEIIAAVVKPNIEFRVFDMVDYFLAGKTADGMRALFGLLAEGESAMGLAALLSSRLKAMLTARELLDAGLSRDAAIKKIGGHPYAAGKTLDAAKRYKKEKLYQGVLDFSNVGYQRISGTMKDTEALELALLKLN